MKHLRQLLLVTVLSTLVTAVALPAQAQEKGKKPEAGEGKGKEKKKSDNLPFGGKITAVDKTAKTITLSGKEARVVQITSSTKITKDGKPATLDDAKAGDEVGGSMHKNAEGKLEAISLRVGPKPEGKGKGEEKKEKKEKK